MDSCRVRFGFVRGVRASGRGKAASACEVQSVPPGPALAVGSSAAFAAPLRSPGRGVYVGFKVKWVQICTGLLSLRVFYVGFMKVLHKTRVYGMGFMANPLETHVWAYHAGRISLKPVASTASQSKSSAKPW